MSLSVSKVLEARPCKHAVRGSQELSVGQSVNSRKLAVRGSQQGGESAGRRVRSQQESAGRRVSREESQESGGLGRSREYCIRFNKVLRTSSR